MRQESSAFIGGYSAQSGEAAIDNGGNPGSTFSSDAQDVTIKYLTIKNFNGTGPVNTGAVPSLTSMAAIAGRSTTTRSGLMAMAGRVLHRLWDCVGSDSEYEFNSVIKNGEGGFNNGTATASQKDPAPWGGPADYKIEHDDISGNAIATCQVSWGCAPGVWGDVDGVAAGLKVFGSLNGTIDYNTFTITMAVDCGLTQTTAASTSPITTSRIISLRLFFMRRHSTQTLPITR